MAELEPLDLDDSDLPSLLRRCKRRRSATPPAAAENPPSQPPNHPQQLHHSPPTSSSRRLAIPGPAGAAQAAMLRKDLHREKRNLLSQQQGDDAVLSTQDYIRKAMDDDTAEFDDDFSRQPWFSALQFLGAEDGLIPTTPISSIKKCINGDKVSKVVAVVKSSTPNGLGGLFVSLKDTTGTIGASIHHRVLSQSEFGKELTVGTVIIIQEVAVFAPVKSAHYFNVTLRNLVKVFCQSKVSTSKLCKSSYPIQYADPDSRQKTIAVEKMPSLQKSARNDNVIQSLYSTSTQINIRDGTNVNAITRECINLSQNAGNEGRLEDMIGTRSTSGNDLEFVNGANRGTLDNMTIPLAETATGEKARGMQTLMSKPTPP